MEEKKIMGMPANVALGLSYLVWPFAIVCLCVDKEADRETKLDLVAAIILGAAATVLSFICIGTVIWVYAVVIAIMKFMGKDIKPILAYDLAGKFVN
ncbi:MAG: hypothetical protein E7266_03970 [Lachnospiraceae bacterium]|nr:hypothetical protein [Lachnospiraceae bacterium]